MALLQRISSAYHSIVSRLQGTNGDTDGEDIYYDEVIFEMLSALMSGNFGNSITTSIPITILLPMPIAALCLDMPCQCCHTCGERGNGSRHGHSASRNCAASSSPSPSPGNPTVLDVFDDDDDLDDDDSEADVVRDPVEGNGDGDDENRGLACVSVIRLDQCTDTDIQVHWPAPRRCRDKPLEYHLEVLVEKNLLGDKFHTVYIGMKY